MNKIEFGDCREIMKRWIDEGVKIQTCITSPPYYGLRDYGTATWEGGDINCDHKDARSRGDDIKDNDKQGTNVGSRPNKKFMCECGATRKDLQIGLEQTPKEYIDNMVDVFNHVKELLADDGTLWVNIGDSYSSGGRTSTTNQSLRGNTEYGVTRPPVIQGIKPKDLIGIPWMLAFALREAGWYLRQDIIWHKPNPMPESVRDRCTKAHEYIFLLTKNPQYYFDNEAIKYPATSTDNTNRDRDTTKLNNTPGRQKMMGLKKNDYTMANKRSVWSVATKPFKGAHFATYPMELIKPCVLAGSKVGDIVFDPFMGSGTTAQVALDNDRQYLGCELNLEYKALQDERLNRLL